MAPPKDKQEEKPYEHQAYPTWRYHRTQAPLLVQSPAVLLALGDDWVDNPGAFEEEKGPDPIDPANHDAYYGLPLNDVITEPYA